MRTAIYLFFLLILLCSCDESHHSDQSDAEQKRGVLSEYVNTPLESAAGVEDINDSRSDEQKKVFDQLGEE